MRSIPADKIRHLAPKITTPPAAPEDPVAAAIKAFPSQLAAALKNLPPPVIAPRPPGSWIIDVKRDNTGKMKQMTAEFHES